MKKPEPLKDPAYLAFSGVVVQMLADSNRNRRNADLAGSNDPRTENLQRLRGPPTLALPGRLLLHGALHLASPGLLRNFEP